MKTKCLLWLMIYHLVYGLDQSYMAAVSGGSSFDSPKKKMGVGSSNYAMVMEVNSTWPDW